MWDERYRSKEYAYGTEPNQFLKQNFHHLPKGRILSLAEGEGRNAVFLAQQGYSVTAVDTSIVGLHKAQKWAEANGVTVNWVHADLADYDFGNHEWDGIVSIFCPLLPAVRKKMYDRLQLGLKQGGIFLLEAYTPEQLRYGTGGGHSVDFMQSKKMVRTELHSLTFQHLVELERNVIEGIYHTGLGSVVQAVAIKPKTAPDQPSHG
ncbi:MAG: hypothetical protein RIR79_550 [Pseudomonadota bacterium]|jgi:SAM-dependent methyltransferase